MKYNPKNHHRRSIRLRGYDYSQAGLYFITICCQNRECLFGEIAVGADLCVCPDNTTTGNTTKGEHTGSPLHCVVQWFKTMTTNEYIRGVKTNGWRRFDKKLWQRNYWEHIIRNENEYQRIAEYMINNPIKWNMDKLNDVEDNMVMESQPQYTVGANLYFRPNKEEWMI